MIKIHRILYNFIHAVRLPSSIHDIIRAAGVCDVGVGGGAYAEAPPQSAPLSLHADA